MIEFHCGQTYVAARAERGEEGWTREQVRETVRALIIEELAVTEFTDNSHFVTDMHVD